MLKRKYFLFSFEAIFLLLIIIGGLKVLDKNKYLPVYDSDEVSWIFTGYYFNLYFLRFGFFSSDWEDYEAFDQPPLGKYIIGGTLYFRGYTIDSLDPKRYLNNNLPLVNPQEHFDLVTSEVPDPRVVIPFTRSVIFVFALSSLLLIYVSTRVLYGPFPAVISTLLIISNPIFGLISTRILGDPILLFFFSLFFLLCTMYMKLKNHVYIFLAFIVASLAFLTKLNGILLLLMSISVVLVKNRFILTKQDYKYLVAGLIVFFLINVLLNPVFVNSGINAVWRMVDTRLAAFHMYQEAWKSLALLSMRERFIAATQMIFFKYSLFYHFIKVPLELIMFVLGIYYIIRRRDLLLVSIVVFLVVIPISILPFNIPRYYYWIFPFIYIVAGLSLNVFVEVLSNKKLLLLKIRGKYSNLNRNQTIRVKSSKQ